MWTKVWTLAGIASDIPNAGDWFKYDLGKESFVVVRGEDGKIRAFYNVCPHRGKVDNGPEYADKAVTGGQKTQPGYRRWPPPWS
ncbi:MULTISPECIES: Rieske 2Fe-2S domain-containing protein [Cupriavidus]|uniref:Rieske 2Fe-2S domain-containing protein n=1 Tax=Cupriavidus sp. DF5525 TaxID=3160989 RepID=UPI00345F7B2C